MSTNESTVPALELRRLPNWGEASKMVNHVDIETPEGMRATRQSVLTSEHPPLFPSRPPSSASHTWLARPIHFRRYDMAEPRKQEKDYTQEVDALIPEAQSLAVRHYFSYSHVPVKAHSYYYRQANLMML